MLCAEGKAWAVGNEAARREQPSAQTPSAWPGPCILAHGGASDQWEEDGCRRDPWIDARTLGQRSIASMERGQQLRYQLISGVEKGPINLYR